jgi:hypothetical protein
MRRVAEVTATEGWVIDGNYSRVLDIVWARADTVVWLDLSRPVVMRRLDSNRAVVAFLREVSGA